MTKLIFFGTQHFGAGMLAALIKSAAYEIVAVVTQPDRPIGRGQEVEFSPVKKLALDSGITTILQPESLKTFTGLPAADVAVVCQYGLIIPQAILDVPTKGTINVHTSLLPKYRGASPIQAALLNGETETGVTIMLMDAKMDHGPILAAEPVAIDPDDTYPTLSARMMPVAQRLLTNTLEAWLAGTITATEQNHAAATVCGLLSRDDGQLNFAATTSAGELYNRYRGTYPWPGIWTTWEGKRLKLLKVALVVDDTDHAGVVRITPDKKLIITGKIGSLEVLELQLEGKKPMTAEQFIAGHRSIDGVTLPT